MPAPRGPQSNTMLYAVITFAALFIIAVVLAIIYYVKAEDYRTAAVNMQKEMDDLATAKELRQLGKVVGERVSGQSRLGTTLNYLEQMTELILGDKFPDTSAQVKVEKAESAYDDTLTWLSGELADAKAAGANLGLIRVAEIMYENLTDARRTDIILRNGLEDSTKEYNLLVQSAKQKEDQYLEQIEVLAAQARQAQQSFNQLHSQMEQNTAEQVQALQARLAQTNENLERQHQDLLRERAEHITTKQSRDRYKGQLKAIEPGPDRDVPAYKADGKIISVHDQAGLVFLNLGTDDRVYRGLTFSVYDKNIPIPKDGRSKAEVEVVDTEKNVSVARIIRSQRKNPIIPDDVIANLIWNSDQANIFVVTGDFDFDGDGKIDANGHSRVVELIERWGGSVTDDVSIKTNFVVLGLPPHIPTKPTHEELEIDPMAAEKYQASLQRLLEYRKIRERAEALAIPVFNTDRFLYFVGYKTLAATRTTF